MEDMINGVFGFFGVIILGAIVISAVVFGGIGFAIAKWLV